MTTVEYPPTAPDAVDALREAVRGTVTVPADPGWDDVRRAWNLAVDQRPAAVVEVDEVDDVAAVVRVARQHGLTVGAQPGGHGATLALGGTVLLRTGRLRRLCVDADARVARVEAGVKWGELLAALSGTGLVAPAGSSPDVTVVGYTLGGGLSWFSRRHGFAADSVLALEVVDPDGVHVRITADTDPELFWALRGGGGDFGIVTAMELRLHPAPHVYGGRMMWPIESAADVLRAYREVTADAPDELSVWATLFNFPPLPELPEEIRGRSFVAVDATFLGPTEEGQRLLQPIRAVAPPVVDTYGTVDIADLGGVADEPLDPTPAAEHAMSLCDLDDATVQALLAVAGPGAGLPVAAVAVRHLGGAVARPREGQGASGHLEHPYLLFALGIIPAPELAEPVRRALAVVADAMAPFGSPRVPFNFLSSSDPTAAFPAEVLARLQDVKRRRDPAGVIRSNRPVLGARGA